MSLHNGGRGAGASFLTIHVIRCAGARDTPKRDYNYISLQNVVRTMLRCTEPELDRRFLVLVFE